MKVDEVIINLEKIRDWSSDGLVYSIIDDCIKQILDVELVIMEGNDE